MCKNINRNRNINYMTYNFKFVSLYKLDRNAKLVLHMYWYTRIYTIVIEPSWFRSYRYQIMQDPQRYIFIIYQFIKKRQGEQIHGLRIGGSGNQPYAASPYLTPPVFTAQESMRPYSPLKRSLSQTRSSPELLAKWIPTTVPHLLLCSD